MRVVKRGTAALLAVIIALSASIIGFAEETNKNYTLIIKEDYRKYYVCVFGDARTPSFKRVDIFKNEEDGKKTLLKMFFAEDGQFVYNEVFNREGHMVVAIDSKDFFEADGSYTIEFYPADVVPEGQKKEDKISIDFNFADSVEPKYEIRELYTTLQVDRELDVNEFDCLPEGFMGEYRLDYIDNPLGDEDKRKLVSTQDSKITALREGTACVYVTDKLTENKLCKIIVKVEPKQAENFFELIKFTFQAIGGGAADTLKGFGGAFVGLAWGIAVPIVVAITTIGSLIFI